ncbi:hypothetical protein D3C75_618900 [compost metagenome]
MVAGQQIIGQHLLLMLERLQALFGPFGQCGLLQVSEGLAVFVFEAGQGHQGLLQANGTGGAELLVEHHQRANGAGRAQYRRNSRRTAGQQVHQLTDGAVAILRQSRVGEYESAQIKRVCQLLAANFQLG